MFNPRRLFYLTAGGALIAGVAAVAQHAPARIQQSAASGPLRYTVRMNQATYALGRGDSVTVEATLTNIGKTPLSVFRPSPFSDRLWLDASGDVLARNYAGVSMVGPRARDIVLLAPGRSVTARHSLFSRMVDPFLTVGRHTLIGEYDTRRLGVGGPGPVKAFWRGRIKTAPLTFTVLSEDPRGHRRPAVPPARRYSDAPMKSLANLKVIGVALRRYVYDHGGAYPPMHDPAVVQQSLSPYLADPNVFVQPGTNRLYFVNPALSRKKTTAMAAPGTSSSTVAVYEATPSGRERGVVFENGAAQTLPEVVWQSMKRSSGIP